MRKELYLCDACKKEIPDGELYSFHIGLNGAKASWTAAERTFYAKQSESQVFAIVEKKVEFSYHQDLCKDCAKIIKRKAGFFDQLMSALMPDISPDN